jgi:hypothetical protein
MMRSHLWRSEVIHGFCSDIWYNSCRNDDQGPLYYHFLSPRMICVSTQIGNLIFLHSIFGYCLFASDMF